MHSDWISSHQSTPTDLICRSILTLLAQLTRAANAQTPVSLPWVSNASVMILTSPGLPALTPSLMRLSPLDPKNLKDLPLALALHQLPLGQPLPSISSDHVLVQPALVQSHLLFRRQHSEASVEYIVAREVDQRGTILGLGPAMSQLQFTETWK